jgi:transcriptional regulator with XRE-family HTH domain
MTQRLTIEGLDVVITKRTKIEDLFAASWLRAFRDEARLTQEALAARAGISERTVQRIQKGHAADLDTLKALAAAFEIELRRPLTPDDFHRVPPSWPAEKEEFDRTHEWVRVSPRPSGRALAETLDGTNALLFQLIEVDIELLAEPARNHVDALHVSISEWKELWWDLDIGGRQQAAADLHGQITELHGFELQIVGGQQRILDGRQPILMAHLYVCPRGSVLQYVGAPRKPILTF